MSGALAAGGLVAGLAGAAGVAGAVVAAHAVLAEGVAAARVRVAVVAAVHQTLVYENGHYINIKLTTSQTVFKTLPLGFP